MTFAFLELAEHNEPLGAFTAPAAVDVALDQPVFADRLALARMIAAVERGAGKPVLVLTSRPQAQVDQAREWLDGRGLPNQIVSVEH